MTDQSVPMFQCVCCGRSAGDDPLWYGCPTCADDGVAANFVATGTAVAGEPVVADTGEQGIFGHRRWLALPAEARPVSLGEGNTPVRRLAGLADELGVAAVHAKDETQNPTWSYKDRLAAMAISAAVAQCADTVALSTTGNHGAATAAYAAAAGLRCLAFTLASVPATMKVLMQSYGAEVVALQRPADRWALLRQGVQGRGWVPISGFLNPPIGSNPYGLDGYRTIAYELVAQLDTAPTVVVVPAAYGDGLTGIWLGFRDLVTTGQLATMPRLVATDPHGAYVAALRADPPQPTVVPADVPSPAFNIATTRATRQGFEALQDTNGLAAGPFDADELMAAQQELAARWGLYVEASSSIGLLAVRALAARGDLAADDVVVTIATSSGLKDVDASAAGLPEVATIDPTLDALDRVVPPVPDGTGSDARPGGGRP